MESMEIVQAVYSSLQAVHSNLVQSMESLQVVYSSLVQSRVDYRQSMANLCSLWAVYRQTRYFRAAYGQSTGSLGKSTSCLG